MPNTVPHRKPDPSEQPFIQQLQQLLATGMERRKHILWARSRIAIRCAVGLGQKTYDPAFFSDLPEDCLKGSDGKLRKAVSIGVVQRIAAGRHIPNPGEIESIAADFGLEGNACDRFMQAGTEYIGYSKTLTSQKDIVRNIGRLKRAAVSSPEFHTELQEVLADMVGRRWFERRTGDMHRDKPAGKDVIQLRPTHLKLSHGASEMQLDFIAGRRPDLTRKIDRAKEREALEELLVLLDATHEEEQRVNAAYENDLTGKKRTIMQHAQRSPQASASIAG